MSEEQDKIKDPSDKELDMEEKQNKQNEKTTSSKEEDLSQKEKAEEEDNKATDQEEEEEEEVEMVEVPKSRLEELENAEEIALEKIKRERAESINYRKRLERQRDEFAEIASARVLTKLLSVQDDIKRILDNATDDLPEDHLEGLKLLASRVESIFENEGVSLIKIKEGETKYDPKYHEAVVAQPIEDIEPNTIITVINQGFQKGERVLRPSKVMIAKKPPESKEEEKTNGDTEISTKDEEEKKEATTPEQTTENPPE